MGFLSGLSWGALKSPSILLGSLVGAGGMIGTSYNLPTILSEVGITCELISGDSLKTDINQLTAGRWVTWETKGDSNNKGLKYSEWKEGDLNKTQKCYKIK